MKILFLNNDENMQLIVSDYFKRVGHETVATSNTEKSLINIIKNEKIDFVIVDFKIIKKSNISLLNEIKEYYGSQFPIYYISKNCESFSLEFCDFILHKFISIGSELQS